jgi:hypothetical protein
MLPLCVNREQLGWFRIADSCMSETQKQLIYP